MWTLSYAIGMGILGSLSIIDIQFRRVPAEILGMANLAVIVYQIAFAREDLWLILGGAAVGVLFLGFSWATRERIGLRGQLGDPDPWDLPRPVGASRGTGGGIFLSCGSFCHLSCPKENVPAVCCTLLSFFDSRVSDQCLWRRLSVRKKGLEASFTVEMSAVAPLCLLLVAACILVFFYFHDKNILSGAAYETATTGSIKAREKDGVEPGELEALFAQRTGGKCILFAGAGAEVSVTEEEVAVNVTASGGGMRLSLCRKAAVTEPEKKIRNIRRFQ